MQFDFIHNRATGGSGTLTLTAVSNEPGFSDAFLASAIDRWVRYTIVGATKRESGMGLLHNSSGTYTLARTLPQFTMTGSTFNDVSPSAMDFTGETVDIYCSPSAGGVQAAQPYEFSRLPSGGIKGRWPMPAHGGSTSAVAMSTSYRFFWPCIWGTPGVIDRISLYASANSASNFRAAVYEKDTNGAPGRILIDFGASAISSTGIKHSAALGTGVFLPCGEYFLAFQADTGSISASGSQYNQAPSWLGISSTGAPVTHLSRTTAYGAFADETGGTFTDNVGQQAGLVLNHS